MAQATSVVGGGISIHNSEIISILQHPAGMFEIYNIPPGCCKFQTSLQGEEIVKSILFRKVCYVLYIKT